MDCMSFIYLAIAWTACLLYIQLKHGLGVFYIPSYNMDCMSFTYLATTWTACLLHTKLQHGLRVFFFWLCIVDIGFLICNSSMKTCLIHNSILWLGKNGDTVFWLSTVIIVLLLYFWFEKRNLMNKFKRIKKKYLEDFYMKFNTMMIFVKE